MTKTKQATDKATARPWRLDGDGRIVGPNPDEKTDEILIADTAPGNVALTEYDEANAALIVQAVNEHAALVAVAEWAQELENEFEVASPSMNVLHYRSTILARKLASLAIVRQQKSEQLPY